MEHNTEEILIADMGLSSTSKSIRSNYRLDSLPDAEK